MEVLLMNGKKKPIGILLDSNAFFVPIYFKIDIFSELKKLVDRNYELILISPVKEELEMLIEKKSQKNSKIASFALKIASEKIALIMESVKNDYEAYIDIMNQFDKDELKELHNNIKSGNTMTN